MTAAIIVGQFVVIILLVVGWWREVEEIHELIKNIVNLRRENFGYSEKIRELEEENRIIINELNNIIETKRKIQPQPEEQARSVG